MQALVRIPRRHKLVARLGQLADGADLGLIADALEAALGDDAAMVGVQFSPVCRVVVLGPARAILTTGTHEAIIGPAAGHRIDDKPDWQVSAARLETADGTTMQELPPALQPSDQPDHELLTAMAAFLPPGLRLPDLALPTAAPGPARPSRAESPSAVLAPPPPPSPDAWWLPEVPSPAKSTPPGAADGVLPAPAPPSRTEGAPPGRPTPAVTSPRSSGGHAQRPARWSFGQGETAACTKDQRHPRGPEPAGEPGPGTREPQPKPAPASPLPDRGPASPVNPSRGVEAQADESGSMRARRGVRMLLSSGAEVRLDGPAVLGRAPRRPAHVPAEANPTLVRLPKGDGLVSRSHLMLTPEPGGVRIRDLGSSNGTLVYLPGRPAVPVPTEHEVLAPLDIGALVVLSATSNLWLDLAPATPNHNRGQP